MIKIYGEINVKEQIISNETLKIKYFNKNIN